MTLIEVMVVVTLSAVLLGVAISLAVSLQHWDSRFREHGVRSDQLARLADAIRTDIRQATDVSLPNKEDLTISAANAMAIRYKIQPEGCRRITKQSGQAAERSELFTIGPGAFWKIERETTGRRPAIVVSLEVLGTDEIKTGLTQMLVYAALGAELPVATNAEKSVEPNSAQGGSGS